MNLKRLRARIIAALPASKRQVRKITAQLSEHRRIQSDLVEMMRQLATQHAEQTELQWQAQAAIEKAVVEQHAAARETFALFAQTIGQDMAEQNRALVEQSQALAGQLQAIAALVPAEGEQIRSALQQQSAQALTSQESMRFQTDKKLNTLLDTTHRTLASTRENNWAHVFHDTIRQSTWFTAPTLSPGGWAVGYPYCYLLYRALEQAKPQDILELGLGQSTRILSQFAAAHPEMRHCVIEHDPVWMDFCAKEFHLPANSTLVQLDLETKPFMDTEVLQYKGFAEKMAGRKFDLISIDAPLGTTNEKYSRVDVLQLIPDCLKEDFVILVDDYHREPEKQMAELLLETLKKAGIPVASRCYFGNKNTFIIVSESRKFLHTI
ncbi:MAG: hypothetical protein LBN05_01940 [Oscillospiraceae bacterium]|nr:hypothetical protein [Oscillospiraceae bacterium]